MTSFPSESSLPDPSLLTPEQQRALLARLLREKASRQATSLRFPMSLGQQGLWHAYIRDPGATPFNVFLPTRFRAPLDVDRLRSALQEVVRRHPSLRTTFGDDNGQLIQMVHHHLPPEFSVQRLPAELGDDEVVGLVVAETVRPFKLEEGPLLRMKLFERSPDEWIVLATTHHIIVDFWSLVIILRDIRQLLGRPLNESHAFSEPGETAGSYADFVQQQTAFLASPLGEQHRSYWRHQTGLGDQVLEMPLDRFRPGVFTGRAASVPLQLGGALSAEVFAAARRLKATAFAVVLSALQVLLSRYSGQSSFYVGSPFSGRRARQFEETVGFFVNMLPLLAKVDEQKSFSEIVGQTSQTIVAALDHERVPVAEIVRDSGVARDPSRSPLFQVSCTFERAQLKEESGRAGFLFQDQQLAWEFAGLRQENFYVPHQTCHYDLEFIFEHAEDRLRGQILYCRDLFSQSSIVQMAENFSSLIKRLVQTPELPVEQVAWPRSSIGVATLRHERLPKPGRVSDGVSVPQMMADMAQAHWSDTAMVCGSDRYSYGEMLTRAVLLAEELLAQGVTTESMVPVVARRGPLAFVGILAAQLAGGAAVPLDADQPSLPLEELWLQTSPVVVLSDGTSEAVSASTHELAARLVGIAVESLPTLAPAEVLERCRRLLQRIASSQAAYIVFTSGSTGTPKGVVVEHKAVVNTLRWRQQAVRLDAGDRVLMLLSHQFDAGLGVGWTTLTQGGTLVWAGPPNAECLMDQLLAEGITVLAAIPSLARMLVEHARFTQCGELRYVWTGGEVMSADLPQLLRQRSAARLWNFYGPTEAAIEATAMDVTEHPPDRMVPIGLPLTNTQILIVDRYRRPLPPTVPGEIAIAGVGLARGYLHDPEKTADSFVVVPDESGRPQRMYLTGDRGRQLADGSFEFLGRMDRQVKLSGYRIELEEIELAIETQPEIERAVAVVLGADQPATARLVAYFSTVGSVETTELSATCGRLRLALRERLAHYKIPTAWMHISWMPLTVSGKVDRRKLPPFVPIDQGPVSAGLPPRTAVEEILAAIWRERLGEVAVSVDRDFFAMGGSSLQAAGVTSEINRRLEVQLPASLLFDLADIAQLASHLCEHYPEVVKKRFGDETLTRQLGLSKGTGVQAVHPLVNPLKPSGSRPPLILVHPPGGIVACYRQLAAHISTDQPVYAIRSRGLLNEQEMLPQTLEEMAADYLQGVSTIVETQSCLLGGWSLGGLVAYEMARQRMGAGGRVEGLVLLDTTIPSGSTPLVPEHEQINVGLEYGIDLTLDQLGELTAEEQLPMLYEHARQMGVLVEEAEPEVVEQTLRELRRLFHHHVALSRQYRLQPLDIAVHLLRPREVPFELPVSLDRGWRHLVRSVRVDFVPGHHHSMVQSPHVEHLARAIAW
jgi:amino acid adenylation domain-containing protein